MDFAPQALFRVRAGGWPRRGSSCCCCSLSCSSCGAPDAAGRTGLRRGGRAAPRRRRARAWTQIPAVVVLALVSLPLAVGALIGWLTRDRADLRVAAACVGALAFAGVIAVSASAVVVPPVGSDVVVALAVGAVCGRVLARP